MPRPKPNQLHDDLDALLDGRPVELTEDLAPLVEAAGALRTELATYQLDPGVADRHLERVLDGSATVVPMPVRQQPNAWDLRRRVAAVALAAALVLAPATMASAAALPGQAMYPFKLAIEQLRLASVQWSPAREAVERTRVADERLDELEGLVEAKMFNQLPTAIKALNRAVLAARDAVSEAQLDGAPVSGVAARLSRVEGDGFEVVEMVATTVAHSFAPDGIREAIKTAVADSKAVLAPPNRDVGSTATPTPTTGASQPAGPPTQPEPQPQPQPSGTTPAEPTTTQGTQTTSEPTTTSPPPPTTDPPPVDTGATPGSVPPAEGDKSGAEFGADGGSQGVPPTTAGAP